MKNFYKLLALGGLGGAGGGAGGGVPVVYGEFTPAEDILLNYSVHETYILETGLGYPPELFVLQGNANQTYSLVALLQKNLSKKASNVSYAYCSAGYGSSLGNTTHKTLLSTKNTLGAVSYDWANGAVPIVANTTSSNASYLRAGSAYSWCAVGKVEVVE